jgi:uncharacterized membrane protein YebE (DUF533 family)
MNQKDYQELAQNVEDMREILRAMVAGLIADGFSDQQAREIVLSVIAKGASS